MYNILLDRLPTEYEGYLIRPSFRIGMQICLCLQDSEFDDSEKLAVVLNLLYGNGMPELKTAVEGLKWFMQCGIQNTNSHNDPKTLFYWDFDAQRIFSSFQATYDIDLTKEDMHWFKFIAMLGSLNKDSAFSKAVEIRAYDMKDLKGKAKQDMMKLKHELTPVIEYSEEEKEQMAKFDKLLQGGGEDVNA